VKASEIPDIKKRRCYDCGYLVGRVTLWCNNAKAIEFRGTQIPGIRNCQFWKAMDLRFRLRLRLFMEDFFTFIGDKKLD